ncbi:exodeoxyribonuclease VII large subunit [Halalkalibacillus halophilus]|uniref:exodeoxyribonuclease VII large subunit n=1 Tax=Halalkalibacillus halophilus TaxID=392827 RepID=UPI00041BDFC1|nr:exodeoxyribonuclease VII large subunit [Halalkalibacillus halophilus]
MEQKYLTVTALTKYIKRKLQTDSHLQNILLQGEISNFNHHSRGHMYFSLKDQQAKISVVMFATQNSSLKFKPENGMKVLITGDIDVYERNGQYQVYAKQMEPDGIGSLYLAYEELKKKLHSEGLFDEIHKKQIPTYPNRIAIVTSSTGAAVRDIITTLQRRYPSAKRTIIPVAVQGEKAAGSIASAINFVNELSDFDTIITGRGGGSIEELWAFNEEVVARSIFNSKIPVISAVGHETDFTIADFVADLRAPTPTAAAELAVPSIIELHKQIENYKHRLTQQIKAMAHNYKNNLLRLEQSYAFKYPEQLTRQKEQDFDRTFQNLKRMMNLQLERRTNDFKVLSNRLSRVTPINILEQRTKDYLILHKRLDQLTNEILNQKKNNFSNQLNKLSILSPLETMKRGYSITYKNEKITTSISEHNKGDQIKIALTDGELEAEITNIGERNDLHGEQ